MSDYTMTFSTFTPITNIVCNGFVMRDVILDVLREYNTEGDVEFLADKIQEAFKIKLGLIQG